MNVISTHGHMRLCNRIRLTLEEYLDNVLYFTSLKWGTR